jgi:hypothetical protein
MAIDPELRELMVDSVRIAPRTGSNTNGEAVYGADVVYPYAKIEWTEERVQFQRLGDPVGRTITSSATVIIDTIDDSISITSRITLPDGSTPPIRRVVVPTDENGKSHTEVYL